MNDASGSRTASRGPAAAVSGSAAAGQPSRTDPWATRPAVITRVVDDAPGVKTYDLRLEDAAGTEPFRHQPGQFNMLYLPGVGEAAISISGEAQGGTVIRHTVRAVGAVTRELAAAGVGSSLGLRGPFGRPWPIERLGPGVAGQDRAEPRPDVVLVAGGVGLAPLRTTIEYLRRHRDRVGRVDLLIGARSPEDLLFPQEYSRWTKREIAVQTTVDRATGRWSGHVGVVTLLLDRLRLPRPASTILLTCGPEVMMRYVVHTAIERELEPSNIYVTLERHMNCAVGLCGHCQLGPEFVCKDGPVFSYDRAERWLTVRDF